MPQKYKILEAKSVEELEKKVLYHLDGNWKCQGGVMTSTQRNGEYLYSQAIVRL